VARGDKQRSGVGEFQHVKPVWPLTSRGQPNAHSRLEAMDLAQFGRQSSFDMECSAMLVHAKRLTEEGGLVSVFKPEWAEAAVRLYSATGGGFTAQDVVKAVAAANGDAGAAQRALLSPAAGGGDSTQQTLQTELSRCGLRELRRRATELGVSEDRLEEALDADDPKHAVT
jgi:hypothetical protein